MSHTNGNSIKTLPIIKTIYSTMRLIWNGLERAAVAGLRERSGCGSGCCGVSEGLTEEVT